MPIGETTVCIRRVSVTSGPGGAIATAFGDPFRPASSSAHEDLP
jgi:hypothetical protein